MRVFRTFMGMLLILLIIGGIGYIAWTYYFMQGNNTNNNTSQNQQSGSNSNSGSMGNMNMSNNTTAQQPNYVLNNQALQNKDKLDQAITTINDAINQITIDPYSKITAPGNVNGNVQQIPGNATINIYPNGTNTVTVTPSGVTSQNNQTPVVNNNIQGGMNQSPTVYDQSKLEQVNTGIYRLSQGIMMLSQLNDDLLTQANITESNPADYQTYFNRYYSAIQNKAKLNNAISLINSASTLININPYGSSVGYQYNIQYMDQFHKGVYKLAQGMVMASSLNQDFVNQAVLSLAALNNTGSMGGMSMSTSGGVWSIINQINIPSIFTIVLILLVIGLIIGIFGAVRSMFKRNKVQS